MMNLFHCKENLQSGLLVAILLVMACALASCSAQSSKPSASEISKWVTHKDPMGFVVKHPQGWAVKTDDSGVIRVIAADKQSFVLVQPFILDKGSCAADRMQKVPKLLSKFLPKASVGKTDQRRTKPDEVTASISFDSSGKPGQANALCSVFDRSGVFYVIAAPKSGLAKSKATLMAILDTFSFGKPTAEAQAPAPPSVTYVKWTDPNEAAFTTEVPKGWKVQGGLLRRHAVDVVAWMYAESPDKEIAIGIGDPEIPVYRVPDQTTEFTGFTEGKWIETQGFRTMVAQYKPGLAFADYYVKLRLKDSATGLRSTGQTDLKQLAQKLSALNGSGSRYDAGDAVYTLEMDGKEKIGECMAITVLLPFAGGALWRVETLTSYIASPGKEKLAAEILAHAIKTNQVNPEWQKMQSGITAENTRIQAESNDAISGMISGEARGRDAVRDNVARNWSNATLGLTDVTDPNTGESWKVTGGGRYYWRQNATDNVTATETYTMPDIDFSPLNEY